MLEQILELIKEGKSLDEIAERLSLPREEVEGALKILETLGYIERVELGSSTCETCPLKSVCPGSCFRFKGQIYIVPELNLSGQK
ncbi:LexA-related DNA-binding protein [Thermococcus onnurineus NA1]|uniref:LexA-related DNA-binding protein n=1 Tax=Thermococcus onnurineus (strain NA1) TaxID=523850 RepID=B6YV67_THEON|nr:MULTISPECIES: DNA-binding protein [Thermococcus]ACJ16145.1 LexA-related DNA-binding protein [Thermococcus onnurineus NA1]NJE47373.1 DNA-binding protein [Thermococcus sp. GR7]NJE78868.1 DNA-binding protein [Thermococcus sp. GR4]NJF23137.1 DNA-binding protein [Thermococcus sp. GR5]